MYAYCGHLLWILLTLSNVVFSYDIVIYGGTSAGVMAGVQAARMGKSVVIIEPSAHLGGMTSSGLGLVDAGKPKMMGGLAHEFFHLVWQHYERETAWKWESKRLIKGQLQIAPTDQTLWVVEPHVAENIFKNFIAESNIPIVFHERLDRKQGVMKLGPRIVQIAMESGRVFEGSMFIDATYEGDLMAAAGVSYIVGREPNALYKETYNGIRMNINRHKTGLQFDPYRIKGDPSSGLLPRIAELGIATEGEGDQRVQAYNYRMCLTDVPKNRVFIEKPAEYDEEEYEIVFRAIEAGRNYKEFFKLDLIPNRKTDSNNNGPVSTDYVGMNWDYPEADYARREQIAHAHENWQRGLVWTLQNHPRIPEAVKQYYAEWGLAKDEFVDNGYWPYRLYVREARRMIAEEVIAEQTVFGHTPVKESIGFATHSIDSHLTRYCLTSEGLVISDGGLYKKVHEPFPVSYRAIVPKKSECGNILVPICLSATHAAYGSIRMEPLFMVLGQSAATAAALAIDLNVPVQEVPYELLRKQLIADKQIIEKK